MQKTESKKNWTLSPGALNRFLAWLDGGVDSEGHQYLEMRERLVKLFDRKNCLNPDELADETLNRVARRLEEEGTIESETPAKYCFIVAKFVFMEHLRGINNKSVPIDENLQQKLITNETDKEELEIKEKRLNCLEHCTDKLESVNRAIITGYYVGKERVKIQNRQNLAESLGITMNALSIRACRIRDTLEKCVVKCLGEI